MPKKSKPYIVTPVWNGQRAGDIDRMLDELYRLTSAIQDEIDSGDIASSGGGITIAQVSARVLHGL